LVRIGDEDVGGLEELEEGVEARGSAVFGLGMEVEDGVLLAAFTVS